MPATIKDISAMANVSIATVSKVLNGDYSKVSTETKDRILRIADEVNYRPNMLARGLVSHKFLMIGLIIPDISNPHYGDMVRGMTDEAMRHSYRTMIFNTDNLQQQRINAIQTMAEYNAAGIVLVGGSECVDENIVMLKKMRTPYVLAEIFSPDTDYCVYVDDFAGSYKATQHLIQHGHREIAYISGFAASDHPNDQRAKGYRRALIDNGIEVNSFLFESGGFTFEAGYRSATRLLGRGIPFTAIACGNDLIAIGARKAIREQKMRIPQDISLVGFDDVYLSTILEPRLTTIQQPAYEIGMYSVHMLMSRIEKQDLPEKTKCFEPVLISRDTVSFRVPT